MTSETRIWVAGQHGMVGSAITRQLRNAGFKHLIFAPRRSVDLTNREQTLAFMEGEKPEMVIVTAGRVGGIVGNSTYPVEFLVDNARIACNVMEGAHKLKCKKLLYLGSSCIYPRNAPQPMKPEHLLTSELEPTNEPYALAKIMGVRLAQYYRRQFACNFISAMPCNLFGEGDRYHERDSHVIPALVMRFHDAVIHKKPTVTCLGDGTPKREFLYVDDLARACILLMEHYNNDLPVNIGSGEAVSIRHVANAIAKTVGFEGGIKWSSEKQNGTPKKLMESSFIRQFGWEPTVSLEMGLQLAYQDYQRRFGPEAVIRMDDDLPEWLPCRAGK